MRVIIAGGRDFDDYGSLKNFCNDVFLDFLNLDPIDSNSSIEIVSGNAKGADSLGERYSIEYGFKLTKFPADWKTIEGDFPIYIGQNKYGKYNLSLIHI